MQRLVAAILAALVLTACAVASAPRSASPSGAPDGSLTPTEAPTPSEASGGVDATGDWRLESGTVDGQAIPLVEDSPVTFTVEGRQIGGTSACNGYGTELVVEGGELRFGEWSSTMMLCEEPVMAVETAFMQAMARVRAAARDGEALLLTGDGVALRFLPLAPPPMGEIVGAVWTLESTAADEVTTAAQGDPATLTYAADGTITGSTGCRDFTGRWVEAAGSLIATELAMDDSVCPPDLQTQDGRVTEVVGESRPAIEDGRLVLTARGGTQATFRAGD